MIIRSLKLMDKSDDRLIFHLAQNEKHDCFIIFCEPLLYSTCIKWLEYGLSEMAWNADADDFMPRITMSKEPHFLPRLFEYLKRTTGSCKLIYQDMEANNILKGLL